MKRIWFIVRKEFRQVFREKAMIGIIFVVPIIQLFIFAYAVTTDLRNVRLSVLDYDRSPASRSLIRSFENSGYFSPTLVNNPKELEHSMMTGTADATLWIPAGYSKRIERGEADVGLVVDGSNSSLAGQVRGYAEAIIRQEASRVMADKALSMPQVAQRIRRIVPEMRYFYNPELESRYFMVPGILVLLVTIISAMLTGMAVVKEKEIGTLEQVMVTPITPLQLIAGKTIPFFILGLVEFSVAGTVAVLWFKIPLLGSIWLLYLSVIIYLLVTLGAGLLVSTVSATQQQAMFTVWFFLVFGILMSGFFYPIDNMPAVVQILTYINPLRYIIAIIRGVFLKGATFMDMLPNLVPLLGLGIVMFSTAILRFRKRVG